MTFGKVIKRLEKGERAYRMIWGYGQYIYLVPANAYEPTTDVGRRISQNGVVEYASYIATKRVGGKVEMWNPSHADLLADDWVVFPL